MKKELIIRTDVSLICLPPCDDTHPLAGLTAIKSYLSVQNVKCQINYLNKTINDNSFFKLKLGKEEDTILPYVYLYNKYVCNDDVMALFTKQQIINLHCDYFHQDKSLADELFEDEISSLYTLIENAIEDVVESHPVYVGFTSKFNQWIPAMFCAYLINQKNHKIKIVMGGLSQKGAAEAIMEHSLINYAIWGEGEIATHLLYNSILTNSSVEKIPRLCYKDSFGQIITTRTSGSQTFISLDNAPYYAMEDYFEKVDPSQIVCVPIERIRGCNWSKCKFCYLTSGYKYRIKSNQRLIDEIKFYIKTHKFYYFQFMDNDFVGNDLDTYKDLLLRLKEVKRNYPEFKIMMAEIITKGLDVSLITMMAEAGITGVQYGLEAVSQKTLTKMHKKQSLADNLFFCKTALQKRIKVHGQNVITGILDEENVDILDSISNIYFFRFILNDDNAQVDITPLGIAQKSAYYSELASTDKLNLYDINKIFTSISKKHIGLIDKYHLFQFTGSRINNLLWVDFKNVYETYKKLKYRYTIKITGDGIIHYKEYVKRKKIKYLIFDDLCSQWVLRALDYKVFSLKELLNFLKINTSESYIEDDIQQLLLNLHKEGIVYYDNENDLITSIINMPEDKNKQSILLNT